MTDRKTTDDSSPFKINKARFSSVLGTRQDNHKLVTPTTRLEEDTMGTTGYFSLKRGSAPTKQSSMIETTTKLDKCIFMQAKAKPELTSRNVEVDFLRIRKNSTVSVNKRPPLVKMKPEIPKVNWNADKKSIEQESVKNVSQVNP